MFKMLALLFVFLLLNGSPVFADCYQSIVQAEGQNIIPTTKQIACVSGIEEYSAAIQILCSAEKANLSVHYKTYLVYKEKFQEAFKKFQISQGAEKYLAETEMERIRQVWQLFGHRDEIDTALATLYSLSSFNCN